MISTTEIQMKIAKRAKQQYLRDINEISAIVSQYGGIISSAEILNRIDYINKKTKTNIVTAFFSKAKESDTFENYESAKLVFLYRFMSDLGMDEISSDDFKRLPLFKIYHHAYREEYEEYQTYMFNKLDAKYYNGRIIRTHRDEAESVENC